MNKIHEWVNTALIAFVVILVLVGGNQSDQKSPSSLGGSTSALWKAEGGIKVSTTGTSITRVNTGTCNLLPDATTIAASSTALVTCQGGTDTTGQTALPGITSGDAIVMTLSSTTAAAGKTLGGGTGGGLLLLGATASNTAGFIETIIQNNTGATYTWPVTGSASGTSGYIATDQ